MDDFLRKLKTVVRIVLYGPAISQSDCKKAGPYQLPCNKLLNSCCVRFSSFRYRFKALKDSSLILEVYVIQILFNLNSQGNEKFELFSWGTYDFQNFGNKTLFIADYKIVSIWLVGCKIMAQRKHYFVESLRFWTNEWMNEWMNIKDYHGGKYSDSILQ